MILNVTTNPLLESRLYYKKIELNNSHRTNKAIYYAGGKGINVSRQLNKFSIQNLSLTFLGGNNGKILRHLLTEENIEFSVVTSKNETRLCTVAIDETSGSPTSFFPPDSPVSSGEVKEFISRMEKMIQNASIIVLSGSSPCPEADEIFYAGIEMANKYDKISILDTYGNHLKKCIELAPTVIHNNSSELSLSLDTKLETEEEIVAVLKDFYSKGIRLAFITDGANPVYASKFDFIYKVIPPKIKEISAVGSGDAFVAGVAYGLENSLVFEDFLKLSVSLGALNALAHEVCSIDKQSAEEFMCQIDVLTVGKKMKIINDSPDY